jgi:hypothetical protein
VIARRCKQRGLFCLGQYLFMSVHHESMMDAWCGWRPPKKRQAIRALSSQPSAISKPRCLLGFGLLTAES